MDKVQLGEEVLNQGWIIIKNLYSRNDFQIKGDFYEESKVWLLHSLNLNMNHKVSEEEELESDRSHQEQEVLKEDIFDSNNIIAELRKRVDLLKTYANLYYNLGNFRAAETAYYYYIKTIEKNLGEDSQETSNCYFYMGLFYLHNKRPRKSISCFKRALQIREKIYGKSSSWVSDCLVNIGIAYASSGKQDEETGVKWLNIAKQIRKSINGENSFHVAKINEALGLTFTKTGAHRMALEKFRECLSILYKYHTKENHPDILRVNIFLEKLLDSTAYRLSQKNNDKQISEIKSVLPENFLHRLLLEKKSSGTVHIQEKERKKEIQALVMDIAEKMFNLTQNLLSNKTNTRNSIVNANLTFQQRQKLSEIFEGGNNGRARLSSNGSKASELISPTKPYQKEKTGGIDLSALFAMEPQEIENSLSIDNHQESSEVLVSESASVDEDDEVYEINEGKADFLQRLTDKQKKQLVNLKNYVYNRSILEDNYNPIEDVHESEFYIGLDARMRQKFIENNLRIFALEI